MKTTISAACDAYKAVSKLLLQEIPIKTGISLYKMKEALKSTYEYACMEERKAQEAFQAELKQDGRAYFQDIEKQRSYLARMKEILSAETKIKVEKVPLSDLPDGTIVNLGALADFVTF